MVPMDLNIGFQGLAAWFRAKSTTLYFPANFIEIPQAYLVLQPPKTNLALQVGEHPKIPSS